MASPQGPKGLFTSHKTSGPKKPGQPGSRNPDAAEKPQAPKRITADGLEKPKKSCTPQNIAFRTFIQPYKKRHSYCKVVAIIVAALVMVVLIIVLLLVCGVFQVAKERTASHSTGDLLQNVSFSPTSTAVAN